MWLIRHCRLQVGWTLRFDNTRTHVARLTNGAQPPKHADRRANRRVSFSTTASCCKAKPKHVSIFDIMCLPLYNCIGILFYISNGLALVGMASCICRCIGIGCFSILSFLFILFFVNSDSEVSENLILRLPLLHTVWGSNVVRIHGLCLWPVVNLPFAHASLVVTI